MPASTYALPTGRSARRRSAARLAVSAAAVLALLTGCGASPADTPAPGTPQLPAGWTYAAGEPVPGTDNPGPQLPAEVTDGTNTKTTVRNIERIIVAGDGVAAILGTLGLQDRIFAAPSNAVAPQAQAAPQKFEFSQSTGAEGLLSLQGTLFIGDNPRRHGDVAKKFRDAGTDAVVLDDQWPLARKITAVAEYVGLPAEGRQLATAVTEKLAEAAKTAEGATHHSPPRIIAVTASGAGGQNSVLGTGTPGTEMIQALGAVSVGAEAGLRGFSREMSNEGLLSAQPTVIVMTDADLASWGGAEGLWQAFPTLQQTPAGQANRVIVMPAGQFKYPSPDNGAGALALARALNDLDLG